MIAYQYQRPAVINQYIKQREFIDAKERYTIIEASTKAGKTVGCIVWLFEQALQGKDGDNYWWVAPISAQAKIAFRRLKRYISDRQFFSENKAELTLILPNGAMIFFKSADNPDSLYGDDVKAAVIDEATRMTEDAWFAVRSTLTKTHGKCKIIGNVKGTVNWVYQLARKAEANLLPDWKYFKLTAADAVNAGVLSADEIEDARRTYPEGIFLELYYAIPFVNSSNKFCYCFDEKKHVASCALNRLFPVYLSFDFNKNPICCSVIQWYDKKINVLEVIKLPNSNIYNLCDTIKIKYPQCLFIVTGDATGQSSSALVKDNVNYFTVIRQRLNLNPGQIQVGSINPKIEENQVLINAIFEHYKVNIDPDKAASLIFDCKFVEMLPDGTLKKGDRNDPAQQSDALDTWRYFLNRFLRALIKI